MCNEAVGRGVHFLLFLMHLRGLPLLQTHTAHVPPCLLTHKNPSSKRLLGTVSWIRVSHKNMGQDAEKGLGILAPIHVQWTLKTINMSLQTCGEKRSKQQACQDTPGRLLSHPHRALCSSRGDFCQHFEIHCLSPLCLRQNTESETMITYCWDNGDKF